MGNLEFWRRCSACKKEIKFCDKYWICSISTCSKSGSEFVFCSVECWDTHNPIMKHRDAWANERVAPRLNETKESTMNGSNERQAKRIIVRNEAKDDVTGGVKKEIIVVVSKLKQYIKDVSEMNTSSEVMPLLSDILRDLCNKAIHNAKCDGRKTVMGRDFDKIY